MSTLSKAKAKVASSKKKGNQEWPLQQKLVKNQNKFMKGFMNKLTNFIVQMFTSNSGISSKRVSGFTGWITFIGICIYCTVIQREAPVITETLAICSSALLGLETITSIWKQNTTI